ncbi:hypothetical protein B0H11DRAFT_2288746 [Mycena galericulata]|nr:hypothetical protein B0H11DRAFT_2288746 [Mycena galericulata]
MHREAFSREPQIPLHSTLLFFTLSDFCKGRFMRYQLEITDLSYIFITRLVLHMQPIPQRKPVAHPTMPPELAKSSPFMHHATLAATTLKQLSEINSIPYVKVVAGVSLLILETVLSVKANKEECIALIENIDGLLWIIIELCVDTSVPLSPTLIEAMGNFAETLQKIQSFMRTQQDMGKFKRFFRQHENATQLEDCKLGLRRALDAFSVKTGLTAAADIAAFKLARESKHQELLKLLSETDWSDQGSLTTSMASRTTLLSSHSFSSLSLSVLLPSAPQIFYGRESELKDLVALLLQEAPRVALLGPGGIGKTSLARSALHHPEVADRYRDRYFVPCDSAGTVEDLALAVATALGVELTAKLSTVIVKHLRTQPRCLLVLDNFETPWEPSATRPHVEEFLSVLADLSHVALLVTMRGQERPSKMRWNRPFIAPLKPLSSDAAHQIFLTITDATSEEDAARITELVSLTGNLPLVVTLMAHVASYEGCETVLSRWKKENVSLLSDGFDKNTNLETSLRISLSSPRMTSCPGALQFLSFLSLLPDGISDVDLFKSSCPIPELPRAKSTLLRTSLAHIEAGRLKVLAPVRELMRQIHPPPYTLVRPLLLHWHSLFALWTTFQMPSADLIPRLAPNVGNFTSLLQYGLDAGTPNLKEVIHGIFSLDSFTLTTFGNRSPLKADIATHVERVDDNQLRGYHIWDLFNVRRGAIIPSEAPNLIAQGCKFHRLAHDLAGECRFQLSVSRYYNHRGDMTEASKHANIALSLAEQADSDVWRGRALSYIAVYERSKGKFREALALAHQAQWLAGRIGNLQHETEALQEEARCCIGLGDFSQAVDICSRARQLVIAGGLEGTMFDVSALDFEADIHLYKTAYVDSRRAFELVLKYSSSEKLELFHGWALVNIASIDVILGVFNSQPEVLVALELPRQIFTSGQLLLGLNLCDRVLANFLLSRGRKAEAKEMFEKCVGSFGGRSEEFFTACMRTLGDITLWHDVRSSTHWATTYLAHGITNSSVTSISWALRLLGDIFREDGDDETSGALFEVALQEFTRMGIYRGRAECLLRLAEIAERTGEHQVRTEYLSEARWMYSRSGMVVEAAQISQIEQADN